VFKRGEAPLNKKKPSPVRGEGRVRVEKTK
jgi:hypothetical protein